METKGSGAKRHRASKTVETGSCRLSKISPALQLIILSFLDGKTLCILPSVDYQFKQLLMGTSLPILRLWSDALIRMEEDFQNLPGSPAEVMLRVLRATTTLSAENAPVLVGPLNETRRSQFFRARI